MLAIALAVAAFQPVPIQAGASTHTAPQPAPRHTPGVDADAPVICGVQELGPGASGTTYIVDSQRGGDFLDLPAAIAAAQPGDLLLVAPGNYSAFVLDKGLAIVGSTGVVVAGSASIVGVTVPESATVLGLKLDGLTILNSSGTVVVQELDLFGRVAVDQCADVRARRLNQDFFLGGSLPGLAVLGSTLELAASTVHGENLSQAGVAGTGLRAAAASRVHVAESKVYAGRGMIVNLVGGHAPDGGPGVLVEAGSEVTAVGPSSLVYGGDGGWNFAYTNCLHDGYGGVGVDGDGLFRYSNVAISGGYTNVSFNCQWGGLEASFGSYVTVVALAPPAPELLLLGTPNAGATVQVELVGEPGATATLWLGRKLERVSTVGVLIDRLVSHDFAVPLGTLDANGKAAKSLTLDAGLATGLVFGMQAEVTGSSPLQRTNSVPIVVR